MTRSTSRRWWRLFTVREWILAAVLGLAALAMSTAGYTAHLIQDIRVEARVDDELQASAEEFRVLAESGVDPTTGDPFDSPEELVRVATGRHIPGSNGGTLGLGVSKSTGAGVEGLELAGVANLLVAGVTSPLLEAVNGKPPLELALGGCSAALTFSVAATDRSGKSIL